MRAGAIALMLAAMLQSAGAPAPAVRDFQYVRGLDVTPGTATPACSALDGTVYAHARPALADVRLFAGEVEVPYALTLSEAAAGADAARVLNRGVRGRHIVFDLAMPSRPYTEVKLDLAAEDFVARARVIGSQRPGEEAGTYLGTFTLFDLTTQGLAGNRILPLPESTYPYLHVDLDVISAGDAEPASSILDAAMVRGAEVPPSREAQTVYTTVARTASIAQQGRETVAEFTLPAHLPVERISFDLVPGTAANFSRSVSIRARAQGTADAMTEVLEGQISRVKMTEHGQQLNVESLSVPATVGSNAQTVAELEVAVDNGDDRPVQLAAVRLEMRERRLCFDVPASGAVMLYYGDPGLRAPVYDYSRTFNPAAAIRIAVLQPERPNPLYQPVTEVKPFTERHPALMWLALLAVVAVLGAMAVRSGRRIR